MIDLKDYIEQSINENLYNGCEELSKFLVKKINENIDKEFFSIDKSELNFTNVFFETLYVFINPKDDNKSKTTKPKEFKKVRTRKISESVYATYEIVDTNKKNLLANTVKWNNETKTFNYIILNIYVYNDKFGTSIDYKMIGHELNHTYEDYKIRLESNGNKTLNDYVYGYYNKARNSLLTNDKIKKIVGYIEYISTGIEIRSFCKQALLEFKENIHKYENLDDAIEKQAQDNEVFKNFFMWKNAFEYNKQFNSSKQNIIKVYKEIHEHDKDYLKESDHKIIKRLENHLQKFHNALLKEIKIYYKKYYEK